MAKKLMRTLFVNGYTDVNNIKIMGIVNGKLYIIDEYKNHLHLSLTGEYPPIKLNQEEVLESLNKVDNEVILDQLDPEEQEAAKNIKEHAFKPIGYTPRGWALKKEFIDEEGNVFHKGEHQPGIKGKITEKGSSYIEKEKPSN